MVDNNNHFTVLEETRDFAIDLYNKNYSKRTIKNYISHLKLYYIWLEKKGLTYLSAIGDGMDKGKRRKIKENINEFKFWLKFPDYSDVIPKGGYKAQRTARTVNMIVSTVLSFYDYLASEGEIEALEAYKDVRVFGGFHSMLSEMLPNKPVKTNIFKEKEKKTKPKYLTISEYKKLSATADNLRDKAILGVMFECGLRVSEVVGLHISDLDLKNNIINVQEHTWVDCKDAASKYCSEGTVFMSDSLASIIEEYIIKELSKIDTNYLFVNLYCRNKQHRGCPTTTDNIRQIIEKLASKCGIEHTVTPHMFRHGMAQNMLSNGISMLDISYQARHKNPSTTAEFYAELGVEERAEKLKDYFEDTILSKYTEDDILSMLLDEGDDEQ